MSQLGPPVADGAVVEGSVGDLLEPISWTAAAPILFEGHRRLT